MKKVTNNEEKIEKYCGGGNFKKKNARHKPVRNITDEFFTTCLCCACGLDILGCCLSHDICSDNCQGYTV